MSNEPPTEGQAQIALATVQTLLPLPWGSPAETGDLAEANDPFDNSPENEEMLEKIENSIRTMLSTLDNCQQLAAAKLMRRTGYWMAIRATFDSDLVASLFEDTMVVEYSQQPGMIQEVAPFVQALATGPVAHVGWEVLAAFVWDNPRPWFPPEADASILLDLLLGQLQPRRPNSPPVQAEELEDLGGRGADEGHLDRLKEGLIVRAASPQFIAAVESRVMDSASSIAVRRGALVALTSLLGSQPGGHNNLHMMVQRLTEAEALRKESEDQLALVKGEWVAVAQDQARIRKLEIERSQLQQLVASMQEQLKAYQDASAAAAAAEDSTAGMPLV